MRLLRRSFAYATIGAGIAGLTGVLVYGPEEVKRQITSNGLVRVGRAARVVRKLRLFVTCDVPCTSSKVLSLSRFNPNLFNILWLKDSSKREFAYQMSLKYSI